MTDNGNDDEKSSGKLILLKKKPDQGKKKVKYRSIHSKIVDAMTGFPGTLPDFPEKFHRWVDHEGNSVPYVENARGIVKLIADDYINNTVSRYWDTCTKEEGEFWGEFAADDATKIRKLWLAKCPARTERFLPLAWGDCKELALHKVVASPYKFGYDFVMTPKYCEIMHRMSDHKVFMAWVGSLFDPDSQRQQYVWIYGGGGNGKSALIRAIMNYLGPVAANENPPTKDAKHWSVGLRNKRLVTFADCNNTSFITSGEFKSLTGEDGVRMEPKGKPAYTEQIQAKFLVSSNDKPNISSSKADLRRVLFFKIGEITTDFGQEYEKALKAETHCFISTCWDVYQSMTKGNPRHTFTCTNTEEIEAIVSGNELEMETFASEYINVVRYPSDQDIKDSERSYIRPKTMIELMNKAGFRSNYERKKLIQYLEREHGVIKKSVEHNKICERRFINCTIDMDLQSQYPREASDLRQDN